ncbi:MAG: sensor histidine kinase [Spirulinaceae cyanobacterium]
MRKILIIEDDELMRQNLLSLVEVSGYQGLAVGDGWTGVQLATEQNPDLILCDILLPELDGFHVVEYLRANPQTASIMVIFTTALNDRESFRQGMTLGADDYITKPFSITEVQNAIATQFNKRENLRQYWNLQRPSADELLDDFFTGASTAVVGLSIIDEDLRFVKINETLAEINGVPVADHLGKTIPEILPDLAPVVIPYYEQVQTTRQPIINIEIQGEVPSAPGIQRYWLVSYVPIRTPHRPRPWVGGIIVEITQRKQIEKRLERLNQELLRSNEELERFAYAASHDLQEPLRTISSYAQLLERRYKESLDDRAHRYIHNMVEGTARMQNLIEDLLAYSRVGRSNLTIGEIDLNAVVSKILRDLDNRIAATQAVITTAPLPTIAANSSQMVQLLQNLMSNALKFRRPDVPPEIRISACDRGETWEFTVSDNGIGIDPAYFERIFHIFERLHLREEYPGTGVGLALCQKIVTQLGGKIWVESQVNIGSTFYFTIPK